MSNVPPDDLGKVSMLELFRVETEGQVAALTAGLLEVERAPTAAALESLMRAAHSLKGAARIVHLPGIAKVAHAMEDCFVAAQQGKLDLGKGEIDALLHGVDFFAQLARATEHDIAGWETTRADAAAEIIAALRSLGAENKPVVLQSPSAPVVAAEGAVRSVRIPAERVARLLGLAGESLVESRRLQPFTVSMQRLKRLQSDLAATFDGLRQSLVAENLSARAGMQLVELSERLAACREFLAGRLEELDAFDRAVARVSSRLYQETLAVRMRPFGDGTGHFPRLVRDLARELGKEVRLDIVGAATQVDRDILEKLDAPLTHLLRNAVDHGCEFEDERARRGKPAECVVRLEARHHAGRLGVSVSDDGRGVDAEKLRAAIVRQQNVPPETAAKLSEAELLDFLFLPGFSLREEVTEISGRGVGLDVVRDMVKSVHGKIQVMTQPGQGTRFLLQLPVTLSVVRALLVEVTGEPYAIPLAQVAATRSVSKAQVRLLEGRRHFEHGGELLALVALARILEREEVLSFSAEVPVVVFGEEGARMGFAVDRLLGQREVVVQPLDARLGKIRDVSAAATLEDGSPVLILDVEDLIRSGARAAEQHGGGTAAEVFSRLPKRVLVVDDSLTTREALRGLLAAGGYAVAVAVDGMDAWTALRTGVFDLLVTDVDMPRLDGVELVSMVRGDARLQALPVVMLSHKDRDEDRRRGLAARADEYLTKGGFQDEVLLQVVRRLTGGE